MIQMADIRQEGLVGKIFFPESTGSRPAVIVLSGSDGGAYEAKAKVFANEGFVAMALAYFNAEGVPKTLENIPLEYFLRGIELLKGLPQVQSDKIFLHGISRGGELVLLLASTFPEKIASVVAVVPGCATFGGIPDEKKASWTLGGKPLPIAPSPSKEDVYKQLEKQKTVDLGELFLEKMRKEKQAFEDALIKVENIRCPILLISGKDDKMWPSPIFCEVIMERLKRSGSKIPREHLCYDKAGHMIISPYAPVMTEAFEHPVTKLFYEIGGTKEAQAFACKDSWEKTLQFFS